MFFTRLTIFAAWFGLLPAVWAQMQLLPYKALAYQYNSATDRLVLVSASPHQLHVYDPVGKTDSVVSLPFAPVSVGVSRDGKFAAVGHDGFVSWVDLSSRSVLRTTALGYFVGNVLVAGQYIYAFPRDWPATLKYVSIANGAVVDSNFQVHIAPDSPVWSSPDGSAILGGDVYPNGYGAFRLIVSPQGALSQSSFPVNVGCAGWLFESGRVMTCKNAYVADASVGVLQYRAALNPQIVAAAQASARDEVAVVSLASGDRVADSAIRLLSLTTFGEKGTIPLPRFVSQGKNVGSQGRYLAYSSDNSRLIAVVETEPSSGITNNVAVVTFDLATPCSTTPALAGLTVPAGGGSAQTDVSAPTNCLWQASSSADWLSLSRSTVGSNGSTLRLNAVPNATGSTRSATITVGLTTVSVTQPSRSTAQAAEPLWYTPTSVAHSTALDRLLMLSSAPDQLHIYDPVSKTEKAVDLGSAPSAISVSPDGMYAAVSLDGRIVRVNLQTAAVVNTYITNAPPGVMLLSATHLYAENRTNGSSTLQATELVSGRPTSGGPGLDGYALLSLAPDGSALYSWAGLQMQFWKLNGGELSSRVATYSGTDFGDCRPRGLTPQLYISQCGYIFSLPAAGTDKPQRLGYFYTDVSGWAVINNGTAALTLPKDASVGLEMSATTIERVTWPKTSFISSSALPLVEVAGKMAQGTGQYIFATSDESRAHVLLKGVEPTGYATAPVGYFVYSTVLADQPLCTYTVSPKQIHFSQAGGDADITVRTQQGCSWSTEVRGGFSVHAWGTQATVEVNWNDTAVRRQGTVRIGDQTVELTQDSVSDCFFSFPSSMVYMYSALSFEFPVEATGGCQWSLQVPTNDYLSLYSFPPATGSGYATLRRWGSTVPKGTVTLNSTVLGNPANIVLLPDGACQAILSKTTFDDKGQTGSVTLNFYGACPPTWNVEFSSSWVQMYPTSGQTNAPQTVQLTVFPEFSKKGRLGIIGFGPAIAMAQLRQTGSSASENARFVGRAYFAAFGRIPSQAELDYQVNYGLGIGLSRADLTMNFLNSAEFNLGGRFIAGLYVGLLARDAEFGGWLFQRNALSTGQVSQDQLVSNFLQSAEWKLKFGTPSDAEFVRLLYRYILLREASDAEVAFQAGALPGIGRTAMARSFLNSQEFQISTGPRLTAFLLHAALFGRDPRPAEMSAIVSRLNAGVPVKTLVQEMLDGFEFPAQIN